MKEWIEEDNIKYRKYEAGEGPLNARCDKKECEINLLAGYYAIEDGKHLLYYCHKHGEETIDNKRENYG